jgi:hypothetical protein
MDWDAIEAIGQMLGSIAVFVTLGYLAVQTKLAHRAASDTARQQRAQGVLDMLLAFATHDHLRSSWDGASPDGAVETAVGAIAARLGVSRDEGYRLEWVFEYWCWLHWGQWSSMTTEGDVAELQHLIKEFYASPVMSAFWKSSPSVLMLDPSFVDFVNAALSNQDPTPNDEACARS